MRASVPRLPTPYPLLDQLPSLYVEDDFLRRFLGALDEVLAPVLLTLDNLPAHLHPVTAPDDFLTWLASWVSVEVDEERPITQRRAVVSSAVVRHRRRGTTEGLAAALRVETGIEPEIAESGACTWSADPDAELPGEEVPWVRVRLTTAEPDRMNRARLEKLITAEVPAHVRYELEILPETEGAGP